MQLMTSCETLQLGSLVSNKYKAYKQEFHFESGSDDLFVDFLLDVSVKVVDMGQFKCQHCYLRGGLYENFLVIDFLVVSSRGDRYLSDAFGPLEKYCS